MVTDLSMFTQSLSQMAGLATCSDLWCLITATDRYMVGYMIVVHSPPTGVHIILSVLPPYKPAPLPVSVDLLPPSRFVLLLSACLT